MLSTLIARVSDGLPLAASIDDETSDATHDTPTLNEGKAQLKAIVRKLTAQSEPRMSIESPASKLTVHYLLSLPPHGPPEVAYLTLADRSFPRKLVFSYLDELSKEFDRSFGEEARKPGLRPYAFQKFDTFMQRTKRLYQDSRSAAGGTGGAAAGGGGLDRLNDELQDVTRIMTRNMEDILARGASLERMSDMSSSLRDESLKYRKAARRINLDAAIRKWAPVGVLGFFFIVVIWWKFW